MSRQYSLLDRAIKHIDVGVRTLLGKPTTTERENPAQDITATPLSQEEQRLSAGLMRINHAGEVSAQGLYLGQSLTAKLPDVRHKMERAAAEENDHLAWCEQRLQELNAHKTYLSPLWFAGSVAIGAIAGIAGDKWSLGFVAETEYQVMAHLDKHLARLPEHDHKSREILQQMRIDEEHHATTAMEYGAASLPQPVKSLMGAVSKVMTTTAYWI